MIHVKYRSTNEKIGGKLNRIPLRNKIFQVDCDVNGTTIGLVLSQEGRPISYFSEKLNDAKRKYFVYD